MREMKAEDEWMPMKHGGKEGSGREAALMSCARYRVIHRAQGHSF